MDLKNWISDWFENEPKEHTKFETAKAILVLLGCYFFFFLFVVTVVSDAIEKGIAIPLVGYVLMFAALYCSFLIHAMSDARVLLRLRYVALVLTLPAGLLFSLIDDVGTTLAKLLVSLIGFVLVAATLVGIAGLLLFGIRQFF